LTHRLACSIEAQSQCHNMQADSGKKLLLYSELVELHACVEQHVCGRRLQYTINNHWWFICGHQVFNRLYELPDYLLQTVLQKYWNSE